MLVQNPDLVSRQKMRGRPTLLVCSLIAGKECFCYDKFKENPFDRNLLLEPQKAQNKKEAHWDAVCRQYRRLKLEWIPK